jgi:hypothetical protein
MLEEIITAVRSGTPGQIQGKINEFNFAEINYITGISYLNKFLDTARQRNPPRDLTVLEMLLEPFLDDIDPDIDVFIGDMAGMAAISVLNLAYIIRTHDDTIAPEMVLDINLESTSLSKMFSFACVASRLEAAFKLIEESKSKTKRVRIIEFLQKDAWQRLLNKAKEKNRKDAINYILSKLEDMYPYAELPKYIKNKINKVPACVDDVKQTKKIVKDILFEMTTDNTGIMEDKLSEALDGLSQIELLSVITGFNKSAAMVEDPDMLEGVENLKRDEGGEIIPCLGAPLSRDRKSCRMLTCICVVEDEDDENWEIEKLSWFKKKCEICSKKIKKACYALRLPQDNGGWVGCYCGEKCCIEAANIDIKEHFAGNKDHFERYSKYNSLMAQTLFKGILDQDDSSLY